MESEDPLSVMEPGVKMEENEGWEPSLLILLPEFNGGDDDDEGPSAICEDQRFDAEEDVFVMEEGNEAWTEEPPAAQLPATVVKRELGEASAGGAQTWGDHLSALGALNAFVGGNQWNCSQRPNEEPLNLSYERSTEPVDSTYLETVAVSTENQIDDGGGSGDGDTSLMMEEDSKSDSSVLPMIVSTMSLSGVHRALKDEEIPPSARGVFPCSCGQLYLHRSSLYKHVQRSALKNRGTSSRRGKRGGVGAGFKRTKNQTDFVTKVSKQMSMSGNMTKRKAVPNRAERGQPSGSVKTVGDVIDKLDDDGGKEAQHRGGGRSSNAVSTSEKRRLQVVHRRFNESMLPSADGLFYCCCGKGYSYYSSLCRHIRVNSKNKKSASGKALLKNGKKTTEDGANSVGQNGKKSNTTMPLPSAETSITIHRSSENKETKEKPIPGQVSRQGNLQMSVLGTKVQNEKQNQPQKSAEGSRTNMATLDDILDFFETGISLKKFGPTLGMEGFQCFCGKVFSQLSGIMGHVHASSKVDPWHCLMSGKLMRKRKTIAQQMKLKRNAKKPFPKGKSLVSKSQLKSGDKKPFPKVKTLAPQMQLNSADRKLFPKSHRCGLCERRFSYLRCLRNHQPLCDGKKVVPKPLPPYTCQVCDRTFPEFSHLRSHERIHENREKKESELHLKKPTLNMNCNVQNSEPNLTKSSEFSILSNLLSGNSNYLPTTELNSTSVGDSVISSTAKNGKKVVSKPRQTYPCALCDRTFPEFAHLRSHERSHENKLKRERVLCLKRKSANEKITVNDILKPNLPNSGDSHNVSKSLSVNSNCEPTSELNSTPRSDSVVSPSVNVVSKLRLYRKKDSPSSQGASPENCERDNGIWMLGASDAGTSEQQDENSSKANTGSLSCAEGVGEENNATQGSDVNTNSAEVSVERKSSRKSSLSWKKSGDFLCLCGAVIKSLSETSKHIEEHRRNKEFCCDVCGKLFIQKSLFDKHNRFHERRKSFSCMYCHLTFKFYIDYAVHSLGHYGKFETCCISCGKKIRMKDSPPYDTMSFSCSACRKRLDGPSMKEPPARKPPVKDSLPEAIEMEAVESENPEIQGQALSLTVAKPATCDICRKSFKNLEELMHHWQSHFGDCTVTLNRIEKIPGALMKDSKIEMKGDSVEFSSPGEASVAASSVSILEKNIDNEKQEEVDQAVKIRRSRKKYFCKCGRGFAWRSTMNSHVCEFTSKYQCKLCPKYFRKQNGLRNHMRFHSGLPRHQCTVCLQRFVRFRQMEIHVKKVHSNNASVGMQMTHEKLDSEVEVSKEGENGGEKLGENERGHLNMMDLVEKTSEENVIMKEPVDCEQKELEMITSVVDDASEGKFDNRIELASNAQEIVVNEEGKNCEKDNKSVGNGEKDKGQPDRKEEKEDGCDKGLENAEDHVEKSSGNYMRKESFKDVTVQSTGCGTFQNQIEEIPSRSMKDKEANEDLAALVKSGATNNVSIVGENRNDGKSGEAVKKKYPEKFFCRCGRGFTYRYYKKLHKCEYTSKYECKICQKRFKRKDSLADHTRSHSGLPRYQCSLCLQRFVRYREMEVHKKKGHMSKILSNNTTIDKWIVDERQKVTKNGEKCVDSNSVEKISENGKEQFEIMDSVEKTSEENIAMKKSVDSEQKELEETTSVNDNRQQKFDVSVAKEDKNSCEKNNETVGMDEKGKGQSDVDIKEGTEEESDKRLENSEECVNKSSPDNCTTKESAVEITVQSVDISGVEEVCDVKNESDIWDKEIKKENLMLAQNVEIDIAVDDVEEMSDPMREYEISIEEVHHEEIVDMDIEHPDDHNSSFKSTENVVVGEQLNSEIKNEAEGDNCLDRESHNKEQFLPPSEFSKNAAIGNISSCEIIKSPIVSEQLESDIEITKDLIINLNEECRSKEMIPPSEVPENSVVREGPKCVSVISLDDDDDNNKVSSADGNPKNKDVPPFRKRKNSLVMKEPKCDSQETLNDDQVFQADRHSSNEVLQPCKRHKNSDIVHIRRVDKQTDKEGTKTCVEESCKDKKVTVGEKRGKNCDSASKTLGISIAGQDVYSSIDDVNMEGSKVSCAVCHKTFANTESLQVHKHVWGSIPCNLNKLEPLPQRSPELRRKDSKGVRGRTSKGLESNSFVAESPVLNMKPTSQFGIEKSEQLIPVLNKSFSKERLLSRSVKRRYQCMVCNEFFSSQHSLKVHRRRCRRLVTNSLIGQESDVNKDLMIGNLEVDVNQLQVAREVTSNKTSLVGGRKFVTNTRQIITGQSVLVNHAPIVRNEEGALVVGGHKFVTKAEQTVTMHGAYANTKIVVTEAEPGVGLSECNVNQEPQVGSNMLGMAQMPVVIYQPVIVPTIVPMLMSGPIVYGNTKYPKS